MDGGWQVPPAAGAASTRAIFIQGGWLEKPGRGAGQSGGQARRRYAPHPVFAPRPCGIVSLQYGVTVACGCDAAGGQRFASVLSVIPTRTRRQVSPGSGRFPRRT